MGAGIANKALSLAGKLFGQAPTTASERAALQAAITAAGVTAPDPVARLRARMLFSTAMGLLGDSITANGGNWPVSSGRSWGAWGAMLNGKFYIANQCGTGGYRTDQTADILLPRVLANRGGSNDPSWGASPFSRLGYCCVLAGTNNVGRFNDAGFSDGRGRMVTLATTLDDIEEMYLKLLATGITPVACTIPPRGDLHKNVQELNAGIAQLARYYGLPLADFYSVLVDPLNGGMQSAYKGVLSGGSADPVHPNSLGAYTMGQELSRAMSFLTLANPRVTYQDTTANPNNASIQNGMMLVDANADGYPDGWSPLNGSLSSQIVTDASVQGKVLQVMATADAGGFFRTSLRPGKPNNWYALMARIKYTGAGAGPGWAAVIRQSGGGSNAFAGFAVTTAADPSVGDGVLPTSTPWMDAFFIQQSPPTAVVGDATLWNEFSLRGNGTVLSIAQVGLLDLGAGGVPIPA